MNYKWWIWIWLFLSGVFLVFLVQGGGIFLNFDVRASEPSLQDIQQCLPSSNLIKKKLLLGTTEKEGQHYYLVQLLLQEEGVFVKETDQIKQYTIISLDRVGCTVEIPDFLSNQKSWTLFLPLEVAQNLAVINLKYEIEQAGGKENFEKRYHENTLDGYTSPPAFFNEDVWAHQQLGIQLPSAHLTITDVKEIPVVDIDPVPGYSIPMELMEYERY